MIVGVIGFGLFNAWGLYPAWVMIVGVGIGIGVRVG